MNRYMQHPKYVFILYLSLGSSIWSRTFQLYIYYMWHPSLSNKILQKGTAAYKINIQFTLWLPSNNMNHGEEDYYVKKIYEDTICFVTGKFKMLNNGSLELVLSCKSLIIEKEKKYRSNLVKVGSPSQVCSILTVILIPLRWSIKLFGSQTRKRTR